MIEVHFEADDDQKTITALLAHPLLSGDATKIAAHVTYAGPAGSIEVLAKAVGLLMKKVTNKNA